MSGNKITFGDVLTSCLSDLKRAGVSDLFALNSDEQEALVREFSSDRHTLPKPDHEKDPAASRSAAVPPTGPFPVQSVKTPTVPFNQDLPNISGQLPRDEYEPIQRNTSDRTSGPVPLKTGPNETAFQNRQAADIPIRINNGAEMKEKTEMTNSSRAKQTVNTEFTGNLDKSKILAELAKSVSQCTLCRELAEYRTQTVFGSGNPDSELVFIGEGPGADEDKQGLPFVGRSGRLLTDIIVNGMKLRREDVYICNIVRCRPPANRTPLPTEAANCRRFLLATLQAIAPKYICCLGSTAALNLLETDLTIGKLRGKVHDWNGIKVVCTYHPSYLLRNPPAKKQTWEDIKLLMNIMGLPIN